MDDLVFGLNMTVIGMGLVFFMLALIWAMLNLLTYIDRPSASGLAPASPAAPTASANPAALSDEEVVAIAVAITAHNAARQRAAAPAQLNSDDQPGSSRWVTAGRARQNQSWQRRR